MEQWVPAWKVITMDRASLFAPFPARCVYPPGIIVRPRVGCGWLACFRREDLASAWMMYLREWAECRAEMQCVPVAAVAVEGGMRAYPFWAPFSHVNPWTVPSGSCAVSAVVALDGVTF